jgi:putative membrane protein
MTEQTPMPSDSQLDLSRQRTTLATLRTKLALDRTTLAWIRTALTMASFGFGMVTFFRSIELRAPSARTVRLHGGAIRVGMALLVLGFVAMVLASVAHWLALRKLRRGDSVVFTAWPLSVTLAILTAAIALAGIWAVLEE